MARKKAIEDYLPGEKQASKHFQCKVTETFHAKVRTALAKRNVTAQDWLEASLKMLVGEPSAETHKNR